MAGNNISKSRCSIKSIEEWKPANRDHTFIHYGFWLIWIYVYYSIIYSVNTWMDSNTSRAFICACSTHYRRHDAVDREIITNRYQAAIPRIWRNAVVLL